MRLIRFEGDENATRSTGDASLGLNASADVAISLSGRLAERTHVDVGNFGRPRHQQRMEYD
jgi:hypothetical protein